MHVITENIVLSQQTRGILISQIELITVSALFSPCLSLLLTNEPVVHIQLAAEPGVLGPEVRLQPRLGVEPSQPGELDALPEEEGLGGRPVGVVEGAAGEPGHGAVGVEARAQPEVGLVVRTARHPLHLADDEVVLLLRGDFRQGCASPTEKNKVVLFMKMPCSIFFSGLLAAFFSVTLYGTRVFMT